MTDALDPVSWLGGMTDALDPVSWLRARAAACRRARAVCSGDAYAAWEVSASVLELAADDFAAGRGPELAWAPAAEVAPPEEPAAAVEPPPRDRNAAKRLARSIAREAGVPLTIEGAGSSNTWRGIRKGDPISAPTEKAPLRAYYRCSYDVDHSPERRDEQVARVRSAVEALVRAGLEVEWSGDLAHCLHLYV